MTEQRTLQDQVHLRIENEDAPAAVLRGIMRTRVEQGLHLPSLCTIRIQDGDLSLVDGTTFAVGNSLEVQMGAGSNLQTIFKGEIVGLELLPTTAGTTTLIVRAYDPSHRLHRGRQTRSFVQVTDSDIATRIAREVSLQPDVESTSEVYDYVLQDNRTNYDFLRERAERIGFAFWVDGDRLHFRRPAASQPSPITLEWGNNLLKFHPWLTAGRQVDEVIVRGWDPQQKRAIVGRATRGRGSPEIGERRPGSQVAQDAFGQARAAIVNRPVSTQGEADAMAQALCDELASDFVQAEGLTTGTTDLSPGKLVDVRNVGQRFSGKYYVTQAVHTISNEAGYRTEFTVCGNQAQTLLDLVRPGTEGREWLCVGVVTNNDDPDGLGRVKVKFPWLGDDVESTWARVAAPMAGNNRGIFFLPEVNDEVLVAFEHGDVHRAYVVGALWNGRDHPPNADQAVGSGGQVVQRVVRTRAGHTILLDDTDGGGGITVEDKSGNRIVLDTASNSCEIKVSGDLKIEAQGKVSIKGTGGVEVESSAQVSIEGTAGVEVESSAQVNVKGAMVNLN